MKNEIKTYQIQKNIGVVLIAIFGFFMLFGVLGSIFMVQGINLLLGSLLLFGAPLAIGVYIYKKAQKKIRQAIGNTNENIVINLAAGNNGEITQLYLAKNSNIPLDESGDILNNFVLKGLASVDVDDNGIMVYHLNVKNS